MHLPVIRRAAQALIAVALLAAAAMSPSAAAAASGPSFDVWTYSNCVTVTGTPTALANVAQLTSGGTVLESKEASLDGAGHDQVCFDTRFTAGMKVRGTDQGVTRTFTIPTLIVKADRTTDVVSGRSPAGKAVTVDVYHALGFSGWTQKTYGRTASSTGTWSIDTTAAFNLLGGDSMAINYASGPDTAHASAYVPRLFVAIGSSKVRANMRVGTNGTVSLRTGGGTLRATAYLAGGIWAIEGEISNTFRSNGSRVQVRVGDKVSAPFQPSMAFTVPNLTVSLNPSTDVISGSCQANRKMQAAITKVSPATSHVKRFTCGSGGTYSVDVTSIVDLAAGDSVRVSLRLSQGDILDRVRVAS